MTGPLALFGVAIGLSAFLLFAVQPLVGRLTLPVFGGTPAAWATVLLFFQSFVLLGYLYAHLSVTGLGPRRGAVVHIALVSTALAALLLAPQRFAELRIADIPPAFNLLMILAVAIGPATFVLASTTPLISAWFARAGGSNPYALYALSNAGSLAALIAYPVVIEPGLGLMAQRIAWAVGFALLGVLLAACGMFVRRIGDPMSSPPAQGGANWQERARWLVLAAIPSGLLLAVTNLVTTDLIAAPLLWVGPLAIYLISFVVAFSPRGRRVVRGAEWLGPAIATLLFVPFGSSQGWPAAAFLVLEFGGFAVVATALHGRLFARRPPEGRLTEFYLLTSVGGVLGGAFVALLAPALFPGIWEYPMLVAGAIAALVLDPLDIRSTPGWGQVRRLGPYVAVGLVVAAALTATRSPALEGNLTWLVVGGVALAVGTRPAFLATMVAVILVFAIGVVPQPALFRDRGFFGVVEVSVAPGGEWLRLRNGTTIHGFQLLDPAHRLDPTAYYDRAGPAGDLFAVLDEIERDRGAPPEGRTIGVVGLGAGTLASYLGPGDAMTFYEIDPLVVKVASERFSFLSGAASAPSVVVGDGRLELERVPTGTFDLLILDAFSSDAVPAHLLTVEALANAVRVVRPKGMVALHLSNLYYDLVPAVAAGAERLGYPAWTRSFRPSEAQQERAAAPSDWLLVARDSGLLSRFGPRGWQRAIGGNEVLTDDHSNLLRYLDFGLP